jgi:uncharacterized membrane protein YkoI
VIDLKIIRLVILSFSALTAPPSVLWTDETDAGSVIQSLQEGQILTLSAILDIVRPVTGDDILEVEVEHEEFGLAYEIYFLDPQGYRRKIYVDARTGDLVPQKLDY